MNIYHRAVMIGLLSLSLAAPGQLTAQSHQDSGSGKSQEESAIPGLHDFDFLVGHWQVHHRKLKQRLANNHEWIEFEGTLFSQPLMGSYSNVDDQCSRFRALPIVASLCGPSTRRPSSGQSGGSTVGRHSDLWIRR